ncbi:hypothetical protein K1719_043909 [Acacia pycnantha]|nr:hypothetical protein K1719_043909 [Acacia pycnantha]
MTKKVGLRNPVKIEAASKYSTVDTLKQMYSFMPAKHEDCYLVYMLIEMAASTCMHTSIKVQRRPKLCSGLCSTSSSTPTGSSITRQKQQDISLQTFRLLGSGMSEHYTTDTKTLSTFSRGDSRGLLDGEVHSGDR